MSDEISPVKIGFWKSKGEPEYPMPVVSSVKHDEEFIEKCKEWNAMYKNCLTDSRIAGYMGYSWCRLCEKKDDQYVRNGVYEYTYEGYIFSEGIFHYIIDHNIDIDAGFKEMILSKPTINGPKTSVERMKP